MKFRLTTQHTYPWPVKISVPDPDKAGQVIEQEFVATFTAMPRSEADALDKELEALPLQQQLARQDDVLRRILVGWNDQVVGDNDKPVPFSAEALEQIIDFSWFRMGVYAAYRQSLSGKPAQGN